MADDEFGTLQEGAVVNCRLIIIVRSSSGCSAFAMTWPFSQSWLALRDCRVGLLMVGALNRSRSPRCAVCRLGADFGISSRSVPGRAVKHGDLYSALGSTAEKVGAPLTRAAAAVAQASGCFSPTDYK